jgi:AGZA family xanthine/uracil permease-like MFS transporter
MMLAAIVTFLLEHDYKKAAGASLIAAALSFFGFIHASVISLGAAPLFAFGYILISVLAYIYYYRGKTLEVDSEIITTS